MTEAKRLLLVDGHSLVYRAFYAVPETVAANGRSVAVLRGYLAILLRALGGGFDYAVVAFDPPGMTFRDEMLDSYKGTRRETPSELIRQLPDCREFTELLGLPAVTVAGFEADDVIGTLAAKAEAMGLETVILSSDKDLIQLVSDQVTMQTAYQDASGETIVFDRERVLAKFGFEPKQMIDYKALVGDSSDNLPGVLGIGEKTAKELIERYGNLDEILAQVSEMPPGRARRALEGHVTDAQFSRDMVTVVRDVPGVELELGQCRVGYYDQEALTGRLLELGMGDLLRRLPPKQGLPTKTLELDEIMSMDLGELIGS